MLQTGFMYVILMILKTLNYYRKLLFQLVLIFVTLNQEKNELIESQQIMAPAAFDEKRKEYESKVQNYNITRQEKLMTIDRIVAESRNEVLNALKPILEEISNEKGITILLEKNSVLLNAENMDITEEALKSLNKKLPSIEVSTD